MTDILKITDSAVSQIKKILTQWDLKISDVAQVARHKKEIKGAFEYGIVLEEVHKTEGGIGQ